MDDDSLAFEARRFRTAAHHYLAGRPAYAARLIHDVAALGHLARPHRVLDLGCGPGQLAASFAPLAAEVVAIDPEPEMLRLARQRAPSNVTFEQASSSDLGPRFGRFHLVTIGRAFHWMDRSETVRRLDGMVDPGGALALFSDTHPDLPQNAWRGEFRALIETYSADDSSRRARNGPDWLSDIAILLESSFQELEEVAVIERRETHAAALIDRALSMSSTSSARLGERTDDLLRDLNTLLARIAPDGTFVEVVATRALIARRG